jgi:hypothetical protein
MKVHVDNNAIVNDAKTDLSETNMTVQMTISALRTRLDHAEEVRFQERGLYRKKLMEMEDRLYDLHAEKRKMKHQLEEAHDSLSKCRCRPSNRILVPDTPLTVTSAIRPCHSATALSPTNLPFNVFDTTHAGGTAKPVDCLTGVTGAESPPLFPSPCPGVFNKQHVIKLAKLVKLSTEECTFCKMMNEGDSQTHTTGYCKMMLSVGGPCIDCLGSCMRTKSPQGLFNCQYKPFFPRGVYNLCFVCEIDQTVLNIKVHPENAKTCKRRGVFRRWLWWVWRDEAAKGLLEREWSSFSPDIPIPQNDQGYADLMSSATRIGNASFVTTMMLWIIRAVIPESYWNSI